MPSAARGISDASPGCGNGADSSAIIKTMRIIMCDLSMREPPLSRAFPHLPHAHSPTDTDTTKAATTAARRRQAMTKGQR